MLNEFETAGLYFKLECVGAVLALQSPHPSVHIGLRSRSPISRIRRQITPHYLKGLSVVR